MTSDMWEPQRSRQRYFTGGLGKIGMSTGNLEETCIRNLFLLLVKNEIQRQKSSLLLEKLVRQLKEWYVAGPMRCMSSVKFQGQYLPRSTRVLCKIYSEETWLWGIKEGSSLLDTVHSLGESGLYI